MPEGKHNTLKINVRALRGMTIFRFIDKNQSLRHLQTRTYLYLLLNLTLFAVTTERLITFPGTRKLILTLPTTASGDS